MEDLWNLKHSLSRPGAQQQLAFAGGQVDVGGSQFSHPFVAQEVCVIERTIRQETVGANLINFGLQGGQKQTRPDQSNQLLALVSGSQQQTRCSSHSGLVGQLAPHQQHFQLPAGSALSGWPGRAAPHGLYPGSRTVGSGFGIEPDVSSNLIGRESSFLKSNRITLPETLDTALFRKPENLSRAGHENIQWLTELVGQHQRMQSLHGAQVAAAPRKTMQQSTAATYNSSTLQGFPASTSGPRVYTLSYSGVSISGELLLTEMGRLEVVCSCHGYHMPVANFVQHAGSSSGNPGSAVYLENGDSLVQWRKTLFSQFAVKVPDDDVGWDWSDRSGSEMGGNKQRTATDTLKEQDMGDASNSFLTKDRPMQGWDSYVGMATQPAQMTSQNGCFSGSFIYSNSRDPVPNSFNRPKGNVSAEVGRGQSSQVQSLQESTSKSRKVVGANTLKPSEYATGSTSEFYDFINRGGQAYCSSVEQQLGVREKTVQSDHTRKSWDAGQENVRQEKDNLASSFELRLGQPSQQAHKAGTSFATTLRSQMQTSGIDQPSSLIYERAYQKTLDTSFQQVQTSGSYGHHPFHGVPGQSNVHQFSQQQRLEKLNVLNLDQFGASGLERTVFSEMDTENLRAKLWTDSASQATKMGSFNQNADNRVPHEHVGTSVSFISNGQLKAPNSENTLEPLPNLQIRQRITNSRLLDDVVGAGVNQTALSFPSNVGQQYLSQEYSQATWMQRGSSTLAQKLSTEETGMSRHREKEQIINCFETDNGGLRSSEEIMSWRIHNSVDGFVQQHRELHLQQEVMGSLVDSQATSHVMKDRNRTAGTACVSQVHEKERGIAPSIIGCSSTPDECGREELSNAILEKEKPNASSFVITEADADRVNALCSSRENTAVLEPCVQVDGNQTSNTHGNNLQEIDRVGFLDRKMEHHGETAAISTVPANSGLLVSVGENELAMPKGHSDKNLSSLGNPISQSFGWKAPTVVDGLQIPREDDILADKSASVDGEGGTSTNKELPSDVCSKSSGNVLSGFSDARHTNEEASTLECESKRRTSHDVVDEGSGIGKCSSDEHLSADKKLESTVSGHKWQESPSSLRRGVSSSEANDSEIMETLQGTRDTKQGPPASRSGVIKAGKKRKKTMKWKRLNAGCTAMTTKNIEAPKGNDSGLTESLAVDHQERVSDEDKNFKCSSLVPLQTPKQKRSRTFGTNRSLALSDKIEEHKESPEILNEKKKLTLLKIRGPQLRDRPRRGREAMMTQSGTPNEQALGSDKPEGIGSGIPDQRKTPFLKRRLVNRRPPLMGNGKMMSLKSILKMPDDASERKTSVTEISEEKRNPKALKTSKNVKLLKDDEGISSFVPPKEIRKRKLSELSNIKGPPAASAPRLQVEVSIQPVTAEKRPFRVGPSVVPRGERSPRQVPKKANEVWLKSKALHLSGTEEPSKHTHVSSLDRNSNPSHNGSSKVLRTCNSHPATDTENRFVPKRKRFGASVSAEESLLKSRKVAAIDTKSSKRRKIDGNVDHKALNLVATGPPTIDSEPASQTQKPKKEKESKGQAIEDDAFDLSKKHCRRPKIQRAGDCKSQDSCSVCGSSHSEASNQLIFCSCCPVKVHQACYGVPKVPKSSWTCRACKSNVSNIVCVLCGYGGGAMTRAQKTRAVVKGLLKAWDAVGFKDRRVKASIKRMECVRLRRSMRGSAEESMSSEAEGGRSKLASENGSSEGKANCGDTGPMCNTVMAAVRDPGVPQWVHMVCALWMPGTRCLNLGTMGIFDVSGVALARRRLTCSICKRQGGSCIQCLEPKCAIPFHPWCAHAKGLLQIETVNETGGRVRFHGRCIDHGKANIGEENAVTDGTVEERLTIASSASKCARTEGYHGKPTLEQRATQKEALGAASVSQEEVGTWIRINERKASGRRFFKPPNSDLKTDHREFLRFKQEQRWRRLAVYKSAIHALGLYTTQNILKGEMVVEYIGEVVGLRVADKREAEYCRRMQYQGACYLFRVDEESIIDATRKGGIARFVNHSCSPNCVAKVIEVKNKKKVVFFAQMDIKAGEEVTYDYHFNKETEDAKIPCLCGAHCCGKKLN